MKSYLYKLYENSWKFLIIVAIFLGIYYYAYPQLDSYFNPPPTKFKEVTTDLYRAEIPESWYLHEGKGTLIAVYSDLGSGSYTEGRLAVYKFDKVGVNDLSESCGKELAQIRGVVSDYSTILEDSYEYDDENDRCLAKLSTRVEAEIETTLEVQHHFYQVIRVGDDILLFELLSPTEELSGDLKRLYDSIQLIEEKEK
jgi:hypothetical protein